MNMLPRHYQHRRSIQRNFSSQIIGYTVTAARCSIASRANHCGGQSREQSETHGHSMLSIRGESCSYAICTQNGIRPELAWLQAVSTILSRYGQRQRTSQIKCPDRTLTILSWHQQRVLEAHLGFAVPVARSLFPAF